MKGDIEMTTEFATMSQQELKDISIRFNAEKRKFEIYFMTSNKIIKSFESKYDAIEYSNNAIKLIVPKTV